MTTVDNNQLIKFNVNVTINENDEAVFKYTENGHEVSGGGEVTIPNTHGMYTLDEATLKRGFYFVGAELSGPIVEDFSFKIINGGQSIVVVDSNKNAGDLCLQFIVAIPTIQKYISADPQVRNEPR